ncbi:MAG: amidase, partial [Jatrophihabitans sp.]
RVANATPAYGLRLAPSELARWTAGTAEVATDLSDPQRMSPRTRRHVAAGRLVQRLGYPKQGGRRRWQQAAERFFESYDVLVTPVLAAGAVRAAEWSGRGWLRNVLTSAAFAPFTGPWNLAGWPAMAVPAGLDRRGMPLSVQLVAAPGGEVRLLGIAAQLERLCPWPRIAVHTPRGMR